MLRQQQLGKKEKKKRVTFAKTRTKSMPNVKAKVNAVKSDNSILEKRKRKQSLSTATLSPAKDERSIYSPENKEKQEQFSSSSSPISSSSSPTSDSDGGSYASGNPRAFDRVEVEVVKSPGATSSSTSSLSFALTSSQLAQLNSGPTPPTSPREEEDKKYSKFLSEDLESPPKTPSSSSPSVAQQLGSSSSSPTLSNGSSCSTPPTARRPCHEKAKYMPFGSELTEFLDNVKKRREEKKQKQTSLSATVSNGESLSPISRRSRSPSAPPKMLEPLNKSVPTSNSASVSQEEVAGLIKKFSGTQQPTASSPPVTGTLPPSFSNNTRLNRV